MRIAVSGTHCVGKSTLIDEFLRTHPEFVHEPEPYVTLVEEYGEEFSAEPCVEDFRQQLEFNIERLAKHAAGERIIYERCPIDFLAYIEALKTSDTAGLTEPISQALKHLDLIIYLPIEHDDTYDCEYPKLRRAVDRRLRAILLDDDLAIVKYPDHRSSRFNRTSLTRSGRRHQKLNVVNTPLRRLAQNYVITLKQRHRQRLQLVLPQLAPIKRVPYSIAVLERWKAAQEDKLVRVLDVQKWTNDLHPITTLCRHSASLKQLDKLVALSRLDPVAPDFYYHHQPPFSLSHETVNRLMSVSKKALSGNHNDLQRAGNNPQAGNDPQRASNQERSRARPNPVTGCPLTAALAAIGGKWKMIIVYWLAESPKHFAALRKAMPGISQKVLTQQLRELMNDGLVNRNPKGAIPAPVEYSLSDYGRSVMPLIEDVRLWGRAHLDRSEQSKD